MCEHDQAIHLSTAMRRTCGGPTQGSPGKPLATAQQQRYLLLVLTALDRHMASAEPSWRLHLRVEGTPPFDIEYSEVHKNLAVARFRREEPDAILVMLADAAGDLNVSVVRAIKVVLGEVADEDVLADMFNWLTGVAPTLAGMAYTRGPAGNGLDMLGMCLADRFLRGG